MKKFFICLYFASITPCQAAVHVNNQKSDDMGYLQYEINKLEQELAQKTEKLNKCASKNKNFQIAGIATVGLATAGVATNIALYSKMQTQEKQAKNMGNKIINASDQYTRLINEVNQLNKNLDKEQFKKEAKKLLTDDEMEHFAELYNNPPATDLDLTDSDIAILKKIIEAKRASQK